MSRNKELNLPALELHPVAVEIDTHWIVWVHDDLVDESLDSLVEVSRNKIIKLITNQVKYQCIFSTHLVAVTTFFLISSW